METTFAAVVHSFAVSGLTVALILSVALNVAITTGILNRLGGAGLPEVVVKSGASFAGTILLLIAAAAFFRTS